MLRVWHIPQVPGKVFHVIVPDVDTACLVLSTLAAYDKFQFANNIKPDYCNASGLEEWEPPARDDPAYIEDDWSDWCDYKTGEDIWWYINEVWSKNQINLFCKGRE